MIETVSRYTRNILRKSMHSHASTRLPCCALVNTSNASDNFEPSSAVVYSDFISANEGDSLIQDVSIQMKRRRYEKGHWDAVIADYKEVELNKDEHMSPLSQSIIQYCKQHLLSHHLDPNKSVLLPCHAIDLKEDGELKAHVDSIRFSGGMVAGLSLLSSSIMRLRDKDHFVDLLLPPLSLYVLTGPSRYEYTHELLSGKNPFQYRDGSLIQVTRDRRVSIIFRDAIHEKE